MRVVSAILPEGVTTPDADAVARSVVEKHGATWDGTGSGVRARDWWFVGTVEQEAAIAAELIGMGYEIQAAGKCDMDVPGSPGLGIDDSFEGEEWKS